MTPGSPSERQRCGDESGVPLEAKLAFLHEPTAYPEGATRVEAVETHMSWVFLTDRFAYKLKKPVRFDFLDFTTIAARRQFCAEEVRLNRRLAPQVYLGTVALTLEARGLLRLDGGGHPVDWLVRMRRLPAGRMLDAAILNGTVREAEVRRVGERLARFYRDAPPVPMTPADYRQRLRAQLDEDLRELILPAFGLPEPLVRQPLAALFAFVEDRAALLDRRVEERRIVEAHGDLRPEHVYLGPEPAIIDCLEFHRPFRLLDPADELAFLALECERLGAPEAGGWLFDAYRCLVGDDPPEALLSFYRGYRACIRAKLAVWHLREPRIANPAKWPVLAAAYLHLAAKYAARLTAPG